MYRDFLLRRLLEFLLMACGAVAASSAVAHVAPPPAAWSHPANPSGGLNIGAPSPFAQDDFNIDLFKRADLWWSPDKKNGFYSRQKDVVLDRDAYGWLRSLPVVDGVVREVIAPFSEKNNTRPGRYVLTWEGEGTLEYDSTFGKVLERGDRRWIISIPKKAFHWITLRATDPAKNGNYIRNIKIYKLEDEPLIEGGEIFQPAFIDKVSRFRVLRMMAAQNSNFTTIKDWSPERESAAAAAWTDAVPVEVLVRMANMAKTDFWISVPHLATDDYVRALAAYLRANLDPELRVYLEYSNEFFTKGFDQYDYFQQQADATFGPGVRNSRAQYYAYRAGQVFDVFKPAFGIENASRLFPVLTINRGSYEDGSPSVLSDLLTGPAIVSIGGRRPVDGPVRVLAVDTYVGFDLPQREVLQLVTDPEGTGKVISALRTGQGFSYPVGIPDYLKGVRAVKQTANQYGLQLYAYEGGTGLVNFLKRKPKIFTDFLGKVNRDPRITDLYGDMYRIWRQENGGINAHFATFGGDSQFGNFATWDDVFSVAPAARGAVPVADNDIPFTDPGDTRPGSVFLNGRLMLGTPGTDSLTGTAQADRIYGGSGNDRLTGTGGADYLSGGAGGDVYAVALATGTGTVVSDNGRANDAQDQLTLTDVADISQLLISRRGTDLIIRKGTGQVTIRGQFAGGQGSSFSAIEKLVLSNGAVYDLDKFG